MATVTTPPLVRATTYIPIANGKAAIRNKEGEYFDVKILRNNVRTGKSIVLDEENGEEYEIRTSKLEPPLAVDVNDRFDYFRQLTELTMQGKLFSLIASGEGGIGKSFTVGEMVKYLNLTEEKDYLNLKGYSTARALFDVLKEHSSKLFIFDDFDNILTDAIGQNILKAVLDTSKTRRVRWMTNKGEESFVFTGSAILITNKNKDKIPQAIISRSLLVDLYMTAEEKIERMRHLVHTLEAGTTLTADEKNDVIDLIDKFKNTIQDLNIRTVVKALLVYENTRNMDIVRYQILQ